MDKPTTLSVKDWIVRNMSTELSIKERIIHDVINHQFSRAKDAMENCNTIEFSGWGKFIFNKYRAIKKLAKFMYMKEGMERVINDELTTPQKRGSTQYKLGILKGDIKLLRSKLQIENED